MPCVFFTFSEGKVLVYELILLIEYVIQTVHIQVCLEIRDMVLDFAFVPVVLSSDIRAEPF